MPQQLAAIAVFASCLPLLAGGCQPAFRPAARPLVPQLALPQSPQLLLPSHQRDWKGDLSLLPHVELRGDQVTVHNVRSFVYESDEDYVVNYYDKTFELRQLQTVDFITVPFKRTPSLAHTMLSFGFADGNYLGVSVEARLERGEKYSPVSGMMRQFELMYVLADERDLIARRTQHRDVDVFVYRTTATPAQSQQLFLDIVDRVNKLADEPEFYDTFTNNCTSNIVRHVNKLFPGRIPLDPRAMLPGFSDQLAFDLGLIEPAGSFATTKRLARVTNLANEHFDQPDFSQRIRADWRATRRAD